MNEKMLQALNQQINAELYSAYLYLSMANYFESINLKGFAKWMEIQAGEEKGHAMRIYKFIIDRRAHAKFAKIDAPQEKWPSPLAVFEAAFAHEQEVTGMINNLVNLAIADKDHATASFLQWFVDEQVEEEANADEIVQKLKMANNNPAALLALDIELGKRSAE